MSRCHFSPRCSRRGQNPSPGVVSGRIKVGQLSKYFYTLKTKSGHSKAHYTIYYNDTFIGTLYLFIRNIIALFLFFHSFNSLFFPQENSGTSFFRFSLYLYKIFNNLNFRSPLKTKMSVYCEDTFERRLVFVDLLVRFIYFVEENL